MPRIEAGNGRKQKRVIKQLHADPAMLGDEVSYKHVAAFAPDQGGGPAARATGQRPRHLRSSGLRGARVAGEASQLDWSEDWAKIAGERTKLQVAIVKLSDSCAFTLRAYVLQTQEMLFDAHNHAFRALGGVPQHRIYVQ